MGVSIFKLKKWINMVRGKSVYHVNQDEGKCYSKNRIEGYYNNLTEKVTLFGRSDDQIPSIRLENGAEAYFSSAIFQYGLGAYDLYLNQFDEERMKRIVLNCANWAVNNQDDNGGWITFDEAKNNKYSSMAQGEGISLLLRANLISNDKRFTEAAIKAKLLMIKDIQLGGTASFADKQIKLFEYPEKPLILNGWIFSAWGLFDFYKYSHEKDDYQLWLNCVKSIVSNLSTFDLPYWSKYNNDKMVTSPFYHKLHIAQLNVMYDLTKIDEFKYYAEKWSRNLDSQICFYRAFIKKACQKLSE